MLTLMRSCCQIQPKPLKPLAYRRRRTAAVPGNIRGGHLHSSKNSHSVWTSEFRCRRSMAYWDSLPTSLRRTDSDTELGEFNHTSNDC